MVEQKSEQTLAPPVTVVVPAFNAAATIAQQLGALAAQDYPGPIELLVVDNASTDSTATVVGEWQQRIPGLRVIRAASGRSASHARNAGFRAARNELVLGCDADDVADHSWVSLMVEALSEGDLVDGGSVEWDGGSAPDRSPSSFARGGFGFLPGLAGCSFAARRTVWSSIGGFDEQLRTCEDIDFAWRAQHAGFKLVSEPRAFVLYRIERRPLGQFRKWFRNSFYQPLLYRRHRALGLRRQPTPRALAVWLRLLFELPRGLVGSDAARGAWQRELARRTGRALGSLRFNTCYL